MNVMAPLLVGEISNPNSSRSKRQRQDFHDKLVLAKKAGAYAVSMDVWWDVPLTHYVPLFQEVINAGLKLAPIICFHACGGGVGDTVNIPVPERVWKTLPSYARFVSEYGQVSEEYVPYSATPMVLCLYKERMEEFQAFFADFKDSMAEINISLGRNGELGFPSYNPGNAKTDYPTRGALQCYGPLDIASFRLFVERRYGSRDNCLAAWGLPVWVEIFPPADPVAFFARGDHLFTVYGRDFFDWYAGLAIEHARMLMRTAIDVFAATGAPFCGIDIGAKIPGVHWLVGSSRLAELASGLIRTSDACNWNSDDQAHGYGPILDLFSELQNDVSRVVLHYTCLEMADGDGGPVVASKAASLVQWIGAAAKKRGIPVKGENALALKTDGSPQADCNLHAAWERIRKVLSSGCYEGLTILRMSDIFASPLAEEEFHRSVELVQQMGG